MAPAAEGAPAARSSTTSCILGLESQYPILQEHLTAIGTEPVEAVLTGIPGHELLVEVREEGNDVTVEVRDDERMLARADHPERRTGARRVIVTTPDSRAYRLRITGKEHAGVTGAVDVRVFDLSEPSRRPGCVKIYRWLAAADSDFADGQDISLGRAASRPHALARHFYLRAAEGYLAAELALVDPADTQLRGETALALTSLYCFNLVNWDATLRWAAETERILRGIDPYRSARAESLAADAWLETASASASNQSTTGRADAHDVLERTRRVLERLEAFHTARHERYDAALQTNFIGLSYFYDERFSECAAKFLTASRAFGAIGETPRRALAWQNRALCFWGLGHLPDALRALEQALKDLGPGSFPPLYILTENNAALANYALGQFDAALRLYDDALSLATRVQSPREEAKSLYGIGVTYYALGDRDLAAEFLERSLAIRTVALDARGRMASLRALANVYAERGDFTRAVDADREALELATAPSGRARVRVQLAAHLADTGQRHAALTILEETLAPDKQVDELPRAQARVRRAVILRQEGGPAAALVDLDAALRTFRNLGSVTDEFAAELERARTFRAMNRSHDALAAVDRALARSDAIRTQTANPELRAQLQAPLRPAYDLKLDLLWDAFDAATRAGDGGGARRLAERALYSADSSRARSFADVAAQEFSPDRQHQLGPELAHRATLYREIAGRRYALESHQDLSGADDSRAHALASEIAGLEREIDTVNSTIAAQNLAQRGANDGAGRNSAPLPSDVAILVYWLGADRSYAWTVTPKGTEWFRLDDPSTITASARAFHAALSHFIEVPEDRRLAASAALYAEILEPVEPAIAPYRRWFVVPDGALSYVPITALRRTGARSSFVVAGHDIALSPAVWLLRSRERPESSRRGGRVLLVSDPVYESTDPRLAALGSHPTAPPSRISLPEAVAGEKGSYGRIPWTGREAEQIAAEFPARDVDRLTGLSATRERLLALDWSQYRFIHIASHGHVDATIPQLSALILGAYDEEGQRVESALRAADLTLLTLHADVVAFSACDTALGKVVLNEGLVGLGYATLARGAHAVVSSLWQVPDESGARLMTEFYRNLLHQSVRPPEALAMAMRSVLDADPSADPALWAPFQVSVVTIDGDDQPLTSATSQHDHQHRR
jgi:CHAT domain-containing protein